MDLQARPSIHIAGALFAEILIPEPVRACAVTLEHCPMAGGTLASTPAFPICRDLLDRCSTDADDKNPEQVKLVQESFKKVVPIADTAAAEVQATAA
jgi:hypothetical protein